MMLITSLDEYISDYRYCLEPFMAVVEEDNWDVE